MQEEILAKYFSHEATEEEISQVESWRSASEENAKAFFEIKTIWIMAKESSVSPPEHLLDEILKEEEPLAKQSFMLSGWVKYASAAILVLAVSLLFILNRNKQTSNFSTETLADGSIISMHGESKVDVIAFDDTKREVRVTGKAYFDIQRDESRPFIIYTDNAKIQVLGTSFVVDSYESKTEVYVESGQVELSKATRSNAGGLSVKLTKGEVGLISSNNKGIIKRNNKNPNYLAWKNKVIVFEQSSMSEVKKVLEDVYGVEVKFDNPAFGKCKLTAKFNKKKLKDALEIISKTFNVNYKYIDDKAILKGKGC